MIRTSELDKHWHGNFWCETCHQYTGQPEHHRGHYITALPIMCWGGKLAHMTFFIYNEDYKNWMQQFKHGEIVFEGKPVQ